ncbi:MAG: ATP-binding protein [Rhodobacteraceae bacterium]|nr:MAG: ATP-binding protein [Paracoccaceae bacterium]
MTQATGPMDSLQMQCDGELREIRSTVRTVETHLSALGLARDVIDDLNLALTEAMTNIARHGYLSKGGEISLSIRVEGDYLKCQLEDHGVAFNPDALGRSSPDPAELREGGYGWYIIRKLSENLCYARENGRNQLSFWLPTTRHSDL